jgi:hypothetical protein
LIAAGTGLARLLPLPKEKIWVGQGTQRRITFRIAFCQQLWHEAEAASQRSPPCSGAAIGRICQAMFSQVGGLPKRAFCQNRKMTWGDPVLAGQPLPHFHLR